MMSDQLAFTHVNIELESTYFSAHYDKQVIPIIQLSSHYFPGIKYKKKKKKKIFRTLYVTYIRTNFGAAFENW